ncbi:hypothetical protein VTL71DRAFT_14396 [Oculimacula yallundae]|uniref:Uncharacterized protein n=1 Tax=Oculimacula yallundae TaxID=86028 RepID=A0ABR4CJ17_9HELO
MPQHSTPNQQQQGAMHSKPSVKGAPKRDKERDWTAVARFITPMTSSHGLFYSSTIYVHSNVLIDSLVVSREPDWTIPKPPFGDRVSPFSVLFLSFSSEHHLIDLTLRASRRKLHVTVEQFVNLLVLVYFIDVVSNYQMTTDSIAQSSLPNLSYYIHA